MSNDFDMFKLLSDASEYIVDIYRGIKSFVPVNGGGCWWTLNKKIAKSFGEVLLSTSIGNLIVDSRIWGSNYEFYFPEDIVKCFQVKVLENPFKDYNDWLENNSIGLINNHKRKLDPYLIKLK